jgi:hypothetical protein
VWLAIAGALLSGLLMPEFFTLIAGLAALTLALRALRQPLETAAAEEEAAGASGRLHAGALHYGLAERGARLRLLAGSAPALHLSRGRQIGRAVRCQGTRSGSTSRSRSCCSACCGHFVPMRRWHRSR